jgi:SsrA-binding protein
MAEPKTVVRDLLVNRKALHEFFVEDRFEAGVALLGPEVKSLRQGLANLQEAWIRIDKHGSAWLEGCHISPYKEANRFQPLPTRSRQLLLRYPELAKLKKGTAEKGLTIIPLRIYLKGRLVKLEIALVKGKKLHDKRATIKDRDAQKEMKRGPRDDR